jgi:hypothetical protein
VSLSHGRPRKGALPVAAVRVPQHAQRAAGHAAPSQAGLPRYLGDGGTPVRRLAPPNGGAGIDVYDTAAGRAAAEQMGAYAFAYRDRIFLGRDPGLPGGPSQDQVLRHEMVHVLQGRQGGPAADAGALERQAHDWQGGSLLSADAGEPHPFLWIPFVIVGGYILLKPNTANAPGPGDTTYKSMDTADYGKMVAEAVVLGSGGAVASGLRSAGYSLITTWGVSGAYGSMAYRGVQDVAAGSFSGVDAYVVDGLTGATIGVVSGGTFHLLGKAPGLSRGREWFMRGAENDEAFSRMSEGDKLRYEIGQKTLANADDFAKVSHLSPVQRGQQFIDDEGWLRAMFPASGKFLPGTGGTFGTGPTPGARWFFRSAAGFGAGAAGNHFLGDSVHDAYGLGAGGGLWNGGMASGDPFADPFADPSGSAFADPFGLGLPPANQCVPTLIVVPEGKEFEYFMKNGQIGDFPVPDGASGLRDYPGDTPGSNPFESGGTGMG